MGDINLLQSHIVSTCLHPPNVKDVVSRQRASLYERTELMEKGVCVHVCVKDKQRDTQSHLYARKEVIVYQRLNTEMIVGPRALHVQLSSVLSWICVCPPPVL